jgi:LytTr DNA-binding domain
MTGLNFVEYGRLVRPLPQWVREDAYGFLYWLLFLLVLEPDNVFRAIGSGHELAFNHEALRITAAAILGSSVTPILLTLTRRFPVLGPGRWRHALIHVIGGAGLAFGLIAASCFLAAWGFERKALPSLMEIHDQLVSNWVLLTYAMSAFSAIAHAVHFFQKGNSQATIALTERLTHISVKTRGRVAYLDLAGVDWIETQGNYLALHVGSAVHMIRETSIRFESRLDASRFIRIHRRVIVAIDRIRSLQAVANGDAILRLTNGRELRASRRYRHAIRERWPGSD